MVIIMNSFEANVPARKREFRVRVSPRRKVFSRALEGITSALKAALVDEGMTISEVAQAIGKNKSFVSRKMSGGGNLTIETLADLAWALKRPFIRIELLGETGNSSASSLESIGAGMDVSRSTYSSSIKSLTDGRLTSFTTSFKGDAR